MIHKALVNYIWSWCKHLKSDRTAEETLRLNPTMFHEIVKRDRTQYRNVVPE